MLHGLDTLGTLLLFGGLVGCSKKALPSSADASPPASVNSTADDAGPPGGVHGMRKLRGIDVPVVVDGVHAGVLRYGELPALESVGTEHAPAYRLADYLEAVGARLESVQAIYFFDTTDRIGSIEGKELRAERDRFTFRFASGTSGNAETRWDTVGLKNSFIVHEIRKVAVFVRKPPPPIDPQRQCILEQTGCSSALPYTTAELGRGTRVYLDGKLQGVVKRRVLAEASTDRTLDGAPAWSLAALGSSLGIDASQVEAAELVAADEVIGRADRGAWKQLAGDTALALPAHGHGIVRVRVPAAMQAEPKPATPADALVTAVLLHRRTSPLARPLVRISATTDLGAQLGSDRSPHEALSP